MNKTFVMQMRHLKEHCVKNDLIVLVDLEYI